ncbi:WW domain-binding protein 4-like [Haliotis rufescens]|uniref:WW domain-binding protein 4-like n=1 Tax=Haliotis rufescens TaxID=6454 RepID=UPI001EAFCCBE|nr:WW domain-binding protein 4-like [Haliotis rufescens]XP_048240766.1 WW domain-binding protein 4-like [Haliotis rufescens]
MATYWKSVPRKFCDFCKCWITDNKPSVDFHEKGKRHQENVKKRIEEVKKKSIEKAQREEEMESDLQKMEKAALEAFKKDLENDPALAAKYFAKAKAAKEAAESNKKSKKEVLKPESDEEEGAPDDVDVKEWFEAKSPEGYTYYWSTVTGESVWEPPDSFVSLAEQEQTEKGETTKEEAVTEEENDSLKRKYDDKSIEDISPSSIPLPVESIPLPSDDPSPPSDEPSPIDIPLPAEEPPPKKRDDPKWARCAYGTWETVREEEPPPDMELPKTVNEIPLPDLPQQEPRSRFKEKKVTSLGSGSGSVTFKKRKLGSGARNVRQRDNDN